MQLLASIPEINIFLDEYKGPDEIIQQLSIFNKIIREGKQKDGAEFVDIKNKLIRSLDIMDCNRQHDTTEFFFLLNSKSGEISTKFTELFGFTKFQIDLFNQNIDHNKKCKKPTQKPFPESIIKIEASSINENDNLIDKIYLNEEIKNKNEILSNRPVCPDPNYIEEGPYLLAGDILRIANYNVNSQYVLISYITYKTEGTYDNLKKIIIFKPIQLYKSFSYNNQDYIIKGIIIHSGNSMETGHYYYLEYDKIKNKWTAYNDAQVYTINIDVSTDDNIYIFNNITMKPVFILYEKRTITEVPKNYKKIEFDLNNHIIKRQKQVNENLNLTHDLLELKQPDIPGAAVVTRPQLAASTQEEEDIQKAIEESLKSNPKTTLTTTIEQNNTLDKFENLQILFVRYFTL